MSRFHASWANSARHHLPQDGQRFSSFYAAHDTTCLVLQGHLQERRMNSRTGITELDEAVAALRVQLRREPSLYEQLRVAPRQSLPRLQALRPEHRKVLMLAGVDWIREIVNR